MDLTSMKKVMDMFQDAVKKLSTEIGKAALIWRDSKFSDLSASVSIIANMSKDVITTEECCSDSVNKFKKIADEKY